MTLGKADRESRVRSMFAIVQHNDIKRWGDEFLQSVHESRQEGIKYLAENA